MRSSFALLNLGATIGQLLLAKPSLAQPQDATQEANERKGLKHAFIAVVMFSLTVPFTEMALASFSPASIAFSRAGIAGIGSLMLVMFMTAKETLPAGEQKPINLVDCSPLSFFKMLRTGSANVRLMFVLLLQSFGELRINQDINMLNLRDNLDWRPIEVSTFMGILGASVTTGGKTVSAYVQSWLHITG